MKMVNLNKNHKCIFSYTHPDVYIASFSMRNSTLGYQS